MDPGETVLWEGQPSGKAFILGKEDVFLIPFSLFWGGFALFWNVTVWGSGAPVFALIWGLPFLAVGFYIVIGRFLVAAARRRGTRYALTNKRAFIACRFWGQSLREMRITPTTPLALKPGARGSVTFGEVSGVLKGMGGWGVWSGSSPDFTFAHIGDPETVYQTVRALQREKE